ncbi:hypothetical protein FHS43_002586 [Streptosporangium becharense]|uniref:Secreted protein n=1 Tax=Streptosporangium becharense TaxID=1816182 RepID=A0A7W9MIH6_9ACTN|nr:hypothetical protein [Streptosporangium becharense]MBB2911321.1 hypothetical protein [Streptosporangium becharense]MBB5821621.1 hypothetical protein [Streptosporangium becharense]
MRHRKPMTFTAIAAAVGLAGFATMTVAASATVSVPAPVPEAAAPAADFTGYQLIKLPNANVPNFQRRTVRCPSGKRAIGGGAEAQGNEAILVGSFPTDDGLGWIGLGRQPGHNDVGISVFVICANVS